MDEAVRVRKRHRLAEALEDPQPFGEVRDVAQVIAQRPALDALHHVEQAAVGQPAGVVDRHDAGMLERARGRALRLRSR